MADVGNDGDGARASRSALESVSNDEADRELALDPLAEIPGNLGGAAEGDDPSARHLREPTARLVREEEAHGLETVLSEDERMLSETPTSTTVRSTLARRLTPQCSAIRPRARRSSADQGDSTQWHHAKRVLPVMPRRIHYNVDTYGGHSGSPVFMLSDGVAPRVVGIHAYGVSQFDGVETNSGPRISEAVLNTIRTWIAA